VGRVGEAPFQHLRQPVGAKGHATPRRRRRSSRSELADDRRWSFFAYFIRTSLSRHRRRRCHGSNSPVRDVRSEAVFERRDVPNKLFEIRMQNVKTSSSAPNSFIKG
jgi:hypothetical protein